MTCLHDTARTAETPGPDEPSGRASPPRPWPDDTLIARRQALDLFQADQGVAFYAVRLVYLAFDRDPAIAAAAAHCFGRRAVERCLRQLAQRAADGAILHGPELTLLAKPAYLGKAQRRRLFLSRLRALRGRADPDGQVVLTLRAMEVCVGDLSKPIWREAAAVARERCDPAVARAWQALLARHRKRPSARRRTHVLKRPAS